MMIILSHSCSTFTYQEQQTAHFTQKWKATVNPQNWDDFPMVRHGISQTQPWNLAKFSAESWTLVITAKQQSSATLRTVYNTKKLLF